MYSCSPYNSDLRVGTCLHLCSSALWIKTHWISRPLWFCETFKIKVPASRPFWVVSQNIFVNHLLVLKNTSHPAVCMHGIRNKKLLQFCQFWGPKIKFLKNGISTFFGRLFFEVKGKYLQIFKKHSFLRSPWIFENENFAAWALRKNLWIY